MKSSLRRAGTVGLTASFCLGLAVFFACAAASAQTDVLTYHNDNFRTGWNPKETVLTPSNVNPTQFGLLTTIAVDDEVDAVPLVVSNVDITQGPYKGEHNVVYVVTANNTIYAIDASAGTILLTRNLGTPVSEPLGCKNNGPNVGVNSTPVIDLSNKTMYMIAYIEGSTGPQYVLHAVNLGNLSDKLTPQTVTASHTLTNGNTFTFNATYQRQRPALLEANGNIYAGFGSFCDFFPSVSRGWMLGWNATTLAPLAANQVIDIQATDPDTFFLSSVWMSGWGPAADSSGNILFNSGNSDPSGTTYDGVTNIQESVLKVTPDLSTVVDLFTPDNWPTLDKNDTELGAGGVMILPPQAGSIPNMAVAAGKDGHMYFMNEDDLGGYSADSNNVLGTYFISKCWCGESYFSYNGIPFVISSGGDTIKVFQLTTSPSPSLKVLASAQIATGQDAGPNLPTGFFTSVSSNGTTAPVIWAMSRPLSKTELNVSLYAFGPGTNGQGMKQLYTNVTGTWPYYLGRYNQVPVVANGYVYVAGYQQLQIYGLLSGSAATRKK